MKQLICYILALVVLLAVCCVIVLGRRQPAAPPAETDGVTQPQRPSTVTSPQPESPASGTDLYLPEPLSEEALAALEDIYGELQGQDCRFALAYLGTVPAGTPLAEYLEGSGTLTELAKLGGAYRFLPEMTPAQCAEGGFTRLYCLVPRAGCGGLRVQAGDKLLYQSESDTPVLFTADGDGVRVSITAPEGETQEFSLTLQADGTLEPQPGILDFTI